MNEKQIEGIRTKYMEVKEKELQKIIGGDKPEDWAGRIQIEEFENTSVTMISVDDKPHTRISLIFGDGWGVGGVGFKIKGDYGERCIV